MAQTLYINVKGDTKQLVTDLKKAENVTVTSGKKMATGVGAVTKGMNFLKGAVVAYLGVHTVKALVNITDTYTSLESKLKLVTSSTSELKTTQAALLKVANESRTSYEGTVSLFTRLSRSTDTLGVSQDDLLKATEAVSKGLIVAGATSEEASSAMLQLSQGLAKGTLDGDELKSVMEAMPDVMKKVAKSMGVAYGDLRTLGSEGKLTSDVIFPALVDILGDVRGEFDQMSVTVGQATTVLKNTFFDVINDANKSSEATAGIAGSILGLAETIAENKGSIVAVFTALIKGAELAVKAVGLLGISIQGYILLYKKLTEEDPLKEHKERLISLRKELDLLNLVTKSGTRSTEESKEERERLNKAILETIHELGKVKVADEEVAKVSKDTTKKVIADTEEQTKAKQKAQEAYEKAVKEVNDIIVKNTEQTYTKLSFYGSEYNKDQISRLTEIDKTWLGINDDIEKDTEKTLEAMDNVILHYADGQKDHLDKLSDDWTAMNDEIEEDDADSKDILKEGWYDLKDEASSAMDDMIDAMIVDGDSMSDAWSKVWKGMLAEMSKILIQMAARYAAAKIANLFAVKLHTGLWNNMSGDEVPAILKPKEMVVPEKYADQIRDNLGDNTNFDGLAAATNPDEWEANSNAGKNLQGAGFAAGLQAAIDLGLQAAFGLSPNPAETAKNFFKNAAIDNLKDALASVPEVLGLTPETSLLGPSTYQDAGQLAAGLLNAATLGGHPLAPVVEPFAIAAGGKLGDMLGDALDDREWELLRDLVEDKKMTMPEALRRQNTKKAFPNQGPYGQPSKLGGFVDYFKDMWKDLMEFFSPTPTVYNLSPGLELEPGKGLGQEGTPEAGGGVGGSDGDIESSPGGIGGVHGGMDYIPKETTYMLDRGERVLSPRQNKDLTSFLNEARSLNGEVGRYIENISILMDKFDRVGILERAA